MSLTNEPRRRRGADLEAALLDAAWGELVEHGYTGLTFEGVATRARTSRPVVYRRWATKPELVLAALHRFYATHPIETPDTGSLRGDVLAYMRQAAAMRSELFSLFTARFGAYFEETGTGIADIRNSLITPGATVMDVIVERAAARGEVDPAAITPRIARLPFDLFRNEALIFGGPITDETLESIVDEVFLPLATRGAPNAAPGGGASR